MPTRTTAPACDAVTIADMARHLVSLMLAEDCGVPRLDGARNQMAELMGDNVLPSTTSGINTDAILQKLATRGWIEPRIVGLLSSRHQSEPPLSKEILGVLENTLQVAVAREAIFDSLYARAEAFGLRLPEELTVTKFRLDREGAALFADAVQKTETRLSSFAGPNCHDLAKELVAYCLNRGHGTIKPESVNDFLTTTRPVSRWNTEELKKHSLDSVFRTAIECGWMLETERRQVKEFISSKANVAWPIMHALDALRCEMTHRSKLLQDLERCGTPIPDCIYALKDVASKSATSQFVTLARELRQ